MNSNWITLPCLIVSVAYFGYMRQPTEMGLAIVASAFIGVFVNLDKFAKFKGAGFEAELRETINEANATIEQLKSIAVPLLSSVIDGMNSKHFMFAVGSKEDFENFDNLFSIIEKYEIDIRKDKDRYLSFYRLNIASALYLVFGHECTIYTYEDTREEPDIPAIISLCKSDEIENEKAKAVEHLISTCHEYEEFKKRLNTHLERAN